LSGAIVWGLVALSAVFAIVGALLALRQLRDVAEWPSRDGRDLPAKLRKIDPNERLARAQALARPGSWEAKLAEDLAAAPSEVERVDAASEAVGDLAALYASRSRWAPAALRIQVAVGLLTAALLLAWGRWVEAVVAIGVAFVGGLVSHMVGEAAADRERRQRSLADEIVLLLVPEAAAGQRRARARSW